MLFKMLFCLESHQIDDFKCFFYGFDMLMSKIINIYIYIYIKYYFDIFSIEKHVVPYYQTHTKIDIDGSLAGNQERVEITS
jgi:hypothetical protein